MSPSLSVSIQGIGVLGPGLVDWVQGQVALREPALWQNTPTVIPAPGRLPPTERRRAGTLVKAAIVIADQAIAAADADAAQLATVFSSSTGDPSNCHLLCESLATPDRLVSPTRFTNSVHNAAAGYWHIAAKSRQPSTSLGAFDATFGAGLLEAVVQCLASHQPVLLVACDVPYPEPLHSVRPVADTFGLAFVLAPDGSGPRLTLKTQPEATPTACEHPGFEALRQTIPAARALPLLLALASGRSASCLLEGLPGMALQVDIRC